MSARAMIWRVQLAAWCVMLGFGSPAHAAVDSYRYLHVTIDTPWSIFLFLLPIVLSPLILMAFLYWRFAGRKSPPKDEKSSESNDDHAQ